VFNSAADVIERNTPFYIWRTLLLQLLFLDGTAKVEGSGEDCVVNLQALESECDEQFKSYIPLLNNILPILRIAENDVTRNLSQRQRVVHVGHLMRHLLVRRGSNRPLILIFDNAQYMDDESLELLHSVAVELSHRVLLFISTRPTAEHPTPHVMDKIKPMSNVTHLRLKPLIPLECIRIACNRIGADIRAISEPFQNLILQADGNPLIAERIAAHCVACGAVTVGANGIVIDTPDALPSVSLDSAIQSVMEALTERLSTDQQQVLQVGMDLLPQSAYRISCVLNTHTHTYTVATCCTVWLVGWLVVIDHSKCHWIRVYKIGLENDLSLSQG
jgi:hypothetical protein